MAAQVTSRTPPLFLTTGRAAQGSWLLFTLLALSLALPGITPFHQLLQTICTEAVCLSGRLTPAEAQAVLAFGFSLPEYADLALLIYLFTYSLLFLTAVTLIWRKPNNRAAIFGAFALTALATGTLAHAEATTFPALLLPAQFIHFVHLAALPAFFCLLPDGHCRPAWLRWLVVAVAPLAALMAFGMVGLAVSQVISILIGTLIVGGAIYRYRSLSASPQQEQAAWVLAAVVLLVSMQWLGKPIQPLPLPAVSLADAPAGLFGFFLLFGLLLTVGALTCLAVVFLSDELFRVEIALNRALVYTLLSLFVVGAYVIVVGYLSLLFQSRGNLWFSLIATGLVAALFQPVQQRVQRFVNSMLYGERAEPYAVVAGLGRRLEAAFAPDDILPAIARTVQESLRLPYVAIALEQNGSAEVVAQVGLSTGEALSFPLTHQGTVVGYLLVNPRWGDRGLDLADRTLLTDLAQQAGVAVHGVRLTAELREMAHTLQQSREHLVLAREEERRRLRRDLHDDLAPTLVGLSLRAGTIGDLIATDPLKAAQLADNLDSAIRDAVSNIRRLVYDLRPPALDDLGLLAAIRERALEYSSGQRLRVEVAAPDALPPLPAAVEVAAYRIVQEGLLNVVKHAHAQTCLIKITLEDALCIEIADDGLGLPEISGRASGVGLRSIRERAAELGGTFHLAPSPESGTRIIVTLPLSTGGRS
ncbi:MAG: histidine kinase [Chloroflexota bacterium]|nr:histidine kinase [Chloroflexota bacterium]